MTKVVFELDDNLMPYEAIGIVASLNENGEEILTIVSWGGPKATSCLGMLQLALDRTMDNATRMWEQSAD